MTNEEASFILANIDRRVCDDELSDALDMAIKALEAQPCEDVISRQAVKETIFVQGSAEILEIDFAKLLLLQRAIKALPSVTPKAKMGRWMRWYEVIESADGKSTDHIPHCKCAECGTEYDPHSSQFIKYCPNCGARMSESEDKE